MAGDRETRKDLKINESDPLKSINVGQIIPGGSLRIATIPTTLKADNTIQTGVTFQGGTSSNRMSTIDPLNSAINSLLSVPDLGVGKYESNPVDVGNYTVKITNVGLDLTDYLYEWDSEIPNDNPWSPDQTSLSKSKFNNNKAEIQGFVGRIDHEDYYKIFFPFDEDFTIQLSGLKDDAEVELLKEDTFGRVIEDDVNLTPTSKELTFSKKSIDMTENYLLKVSAGLRSKDIEDEGKASTPYTLSISSTATTPIAEPILQFNAATFTGKETDKKAVITVKREGDTATAVKATVNLTPGTATENQDYSPDPIMVDFASGETSKSIEVPLVDDGKPEGDETVNLTLVNPSIGKLGTQSTATLNITDGSASSQSVSVTKPNANSTDGGTPSNQTPFSQEGSYYRLSNQNDSFVIADDKIGKQILGLSGGDKITGSDQDDSLFGMQGADELTGNTGNDQLYGGKGSDNVDGGSGQDQLRGDNDNDTVNGGDGDDLLFGGKESDILMGGSGNDKLSGDRGQDFLTGDGGNDTFILGSGDFASPSINQADVITDFSKTEDKIGLKNGISFRSLTLEPISLSVNGGVGVNSTALKLNNEYLGVISGVVPADLDESLFISAS